MNRTAFAVLFAASVFATSARGQGVMQPLLITFDGPPIVTPGTEVSFSQYEEAGMSFESGFGPSVRRGSSPGLGWPDNGSAYLQISGAVLGFDFTNGMVFDLLSIDIAELSITDTNTTFSIIGRQQGGGTVMTNFTLDGVIDGAGPISDFETLVFGAEFKNLIGAEASFNGSLDNLVVAVPEPSVVALLLVGGGLSASLRARRRSRSINTSGP